MFASHAPCIVILSLVTDYKRIYNNLRNKNKHSDKLLFVQTLVMQVCKFFHCHPKQEHCGMYYSSFDFNFMPVHFPIALGLFVIRDFC